MKAPRLFTAALALTVVVAGTAITHGMRGHRQQAENDAVMTGGCGENPMRERHDVRGDANHAHQMIMRRHESHRPAGATAPAPATSQSTPAQRQRCNCVASG